MPEARVRIPFGVLNINKPKGVSSRAVVDKVVRVAGRRVKIGHAGTLDPLATGVLVVCVGAATRLIEYVQRQSKTYQTVVRLGATSDTLDADGAVTERADATDPGLVAIELAVAGQVGTILQQPPDYSALKIDGKRAYDLARAGKDVVLAPRPVTIHSVNILAYEWPRLTLEVSCEGGTYIRSIARDIGEALGCGGLVEILVRTRIGAFTIEDAIDPDTLSAETLKNQMKPAVEAVAQLPVIQISEEQIAEITMGRAITIDIPLPEGEVALLGPSGELVAVGETVRALQRIEPRRVLVGQN